MLEAATKIIAYTKGMDFEEFEGDEKTVDAIIRNFEIIGEAANRLKEEFKSTNTEIDWEK